VIASDKKSVSTFKTAARITDADEMEVFRDTQAESIGQKAYTKEDSRFIRSKLPIRHAFKIGVSGIRNKPFRLFFTVLLCSVAFVLFGLLSTLNFYDSEATFKQTLTDAQLSGLQLRKEYTAKTTWYTNGEEDYYYDNIQQGKFSPSDLKDIAHRLNPNAFGGVSMYGSFNLRQVESVYWMNNIAAYAVLPEGNPLRGQITGEYPKAKGEMVLSSYFAEMLKECKVYSDTGATPELNDAKDMIGKSIVLDGRTYKITGILDYGRVVYARIAVGRQSVIAPYNGRVGEAVSIAIDQSKLTVVDAEADIIIV
jgi:hypothetical protein